MKALLAKLFTGNPVGSITLASLLSLGGTYLATHFDVTKLTPTGAAIYTVLVSVVGVLTHHTATKAGTP